MTRRPSPEGARHRFTARVDGNLAIDVEPATLEARRRSVVDAPWTWLRQVHGADVVTVRGPGQGAGAPADGAVTAAPGAVLAVQHADCAPVVLLADGVVGVAHAGWRGLVAGVVEAAVAAMRQAGAGEVRAVIGPCIRARCYEFGAGELALVAEAPGESVRATTSAGAGGLDLAAGVRAALERSGVAAVDDTGACTACEGDRYFSHRARAERERQATVVWLEP